MKTIKISMQNYTGMGKKRGHYYPGMVPEQLDLLWYQKALCRGKVLLQLFLGKIVCSDTQILSDFQTPKPLQELSLLNLGCFFSEASGSRVEAAWVSGVGMLSLLGSCGE